MVQGQYIAKVFSAVLFLHRVITLGKQSAIHRHAQQGNPHVVEIAKHASVNTGPIVNGHGR